MKRKTTDDVAKIGRGHHYPARCFFSTSSLVFPRREEAQLEVISSQFWRWTNVDTCAKKQTKPFSHGWKGRTASTVVRRRARLVRQRPMKAIYQLGTCFFLWKKRKRERQRREVFPEDLFPLAWGDALVDFLSWIAVILWRFASLTFNFVSPKREQRGGDEGGLIIHSWSSSSRTRRVPFLGFGVGQVTILSRRCFLREDRQETMYVTDMFHHSTSCVLNRPLFKSLLL